MVYTHWNLVLLLLRKFGINFLFLLLFLKRTVKKTRNLFNYQKTKKEFLNQQEFN